MSKPAVEVTNLGKKYIIRRQNKPDSLRELLSSNPLNKTRDPEVHNETLWALKHANFDVRPGETMGIVGRNGAGKSTLLKILSRVVSPTIGNAIIRGKVASLLEVGTGFHPELTGRENVFFNGALLGMGKAEIAAKFNSIVEFSEVERFIDTPVKRYSSGMRGRLAFSVAAHLDADIMIIDEVLSTGDLTFRKKATDKMKSAAFDGRSVLFVSHTMTSVEDLCDRAVYLKSGEQVMVGEAKEVIEAYLGETSIKPMAEWKADYSTTRPQDERVVPESMRILVNGKHTKDMVVEYSDELEIEMTVRIKKPNKAMSIGLSINDEQGRRLYRSAHTDLPKGQVPELSKGSNTFRIPIPLDLLKAGEYSASMDCDIYKDVWIVNPRSDGAKVGFRLKEEPELFPLWDPKREGILKPRLEWRKVD